MTKLDDILGLGDLDTKELERIALGQALRRAAEGKDGPPSTPLGAEATSPADHEKPTVMGQVPDLDSFKAALGAEGKAAFGAEGREGPPLGADGEKVTVIATAGMTPAKAGPFGEMPTVQASQAVLKDIRAEALAALEAQGVDIRAPVQEHTMPLTPKPMPAAKPVAAKADAPARAPAQGTAAAAVPTTAMPPVVAASPAVAKDPAKTTMQVKAAPPRKRGVGGTILMVMVGLVAIGAASGAVVFGMRAQKAQQAAASPQTPAPKENKDDAVSFSATKGKPVDVPVATVEAKPPEAKPDEAKPPATATEPEPKPPATVAAATPEPKADPKKDPPKAAALPPPTPPPTVAKADPPKADPPKADPPKKPAAVAAKADPPPAAPPPAAPPPQPAKPSVDSLLQQQLNSAIP